MIPINKNYLGVALVGLAIVVFWIFGMPKLDRLSLLNDAIAERRVILATRQNVVNRTEDLNKQYRERLDDIGKISSVVPNTQNTAELISAIEVTTQQSGLQLSEIAVTKSDNKQEELQTIVVELELSGNYLSLITLLDLLEKNLRLVDVSEINISQATSTEGLITLNFRIKAGTYYLNIK